MNQRAWMIAILIAQIASLEIACGSSTSASTPIAASPVPPPFSGTIHDTLNAAGSSSNFDWHYSNAVNDRSQNRSFDDFVSPANAAIRTVAWQGTYCESTFLISSVPAPTATSFSVAFYQDRGGYPAWYPDATVPSSQVPLFGASFAVSQLQEQLDQTTLAGSCGSRFPAPAALYNYRLTLPIPFQVTQGQRYWLGIQANTSQAGVLWAWRVGVPDNRLSAFLLAESTSTTYFTDLAFSLTP